MGQDGEDRKGGGVIDEDEFEAEVAADLGVEKALFWRGMASVGIVLLMLVVRQLFFI